MTAPTDMERGATVTTPASGTIATDGTITRGIAITASIGNMTDATIGSMAERTGSTIGRVGSAATISGVRAGTGTGTADARRYFRFAVLSSLVPPPG